MDISQQAKAFARLSAAEDGFPEKERARAVLEYIDKNVPQNRRAALLKKYAAALKAIIARKTAVITSAGELSPQTLEYLKEKISKRAGGRAIIKTEVDPSLAGGVRVKIGDDVFERSAKDFLERLAKD